MDDPTVVQPAVTSISTAQSGLESIRRGSECGFGFGTLCFPRPSGGRDVGTTWASPPAMESGTLAANTRCATTQSLLQAEALAPVVTGR